jgi:hypothetical protein
VVNEMAGDITHVDSSDESPSAYVDEIRRDEYRCTVSALNSGQTGNNSHCNELCCSTIY